MTLREKLSECRRIAFSSGPLLEYDNTPIEEMYQDVWALINGRQEDATKQIRHCLNSSEDYSKILPAMMSYTMSCILEPTFFKLHKAFPLIYALNIFVTLKSSSQFFIYTSPFANLNCARSYLFSDLPYWEIWQGIIDMAQKDDLFKGEICKSPDDKEITYRFSMVLDK